MDISLRPLLLAPLLLSLTATAAPVDADMARWRAEAARVTITRDDWGIPHVHGKSDADAVFGMIYAQAEDDFPRVEANYLTALGRSAEADGEEAIWADLRQRLWVDPAALKREYAASPAWLRALMDAWADGLNHYLATHPEVRPKVLTRFEPWMALSFTEGSIGGDIERVSLSELKTFYGNPTPPTPEENGSVPREPSGSNGIAIAPKITANGHALLLINPHTSFYFRSEAQMTSDAGLDAYGASTWGQFFIYQGFNAKAGWMHTSSTVDNVDEFAEKVRKAGDGYVYAYGSASRAVTSERVTLRYRRADGSMGERGFTTWRTHHGPIVAARGGRWIATALMWKPVPALEQSYLRTKATDLAGFMRIAERKANSSNDTLFADSKGEIAFLMPQFMPLRDNRFDYTRPVDGSDPATDWKGLHALPSLPNVLNPGTGWVKNTNDWPWSAAGADSPKAADFPRYMDQTGGNARGAHHRQDRLDGGEDSRRGVRQLSPRLREADPATGLGMGCAARRRSAPREPCRAGRAAARLGLSLGLRFHRDQPRGVLGRSPVARGRQLRAGRADERARLYRGESLPRRAARRAGSSGDAADRRFRRLADQMARDQPLPAAGRRDQSTFRRQGRVAAGALHLGAMGQPRLVRREAVAGDEALLRHQRQQLRRDRRVRPAREGHGGQSGDLKSPHFADQIRRYADGQLRPVYFYPDELQGHVERRYRPGE